ncbi:MAG: hypothetical protein ACE5HQ_02465 [Gemmatimonadota bacterium]
MWDTRPVEMIVHLPCDLADNVEEVRDRHPEFLGEAIRYALARRIVFDELSACLAEPTTERPSTHLP